MSCARAAVAVSVKLDLQEEDCNCNDTSNGEDVRVKVMNVMILSDLDRLIMVVTIMEHWNEIMHDFLTSSRYIRCCGIL